MAELTPLEKLQPCLLDRLTDDDPKVFTHPWTYAFNMKLVPNERMYEDVTCSNEKDFAHEVPTKSAE